MEKNVLVVIPAEQRHREKLETAGKGCRFVYSSYAEVTKEMTAQANVIIGNVPADFIKGHKSLDLLQLNSAGADDYIKPGVLPENTVLCNATGAYGKAVAEHCFISALMLQKKLHLYRDDQKKHLWTDEGNVTSITDATVLIVGLGNIGLHFARMAKALGAPRVIGLKRRGGEKPEGIDELYLTDALDDYLPQADIIASFLPGTVQTRHIYTRERFEKMKKSAIFVNGGRGSAVSLDTLQSVLEDGVIAAAAVDVLETEPLPADSPLWDIPNLMLTPHISGNFHLQETFERIVDIAAANLSAYVEGREIGNIVDLETGYKK